MAKKKFVSIDHSRRVICEFEKFDLTNPSDLKGRHNLAIKGGGTSIPGSYFGKKLTVLETFADKNVISYKAESFEIEVNASITINELYDFLVPQNRFVTSVPSYPGASVGGCIASNVHGQNHNKNGCFENNVISFKLYHPAKGTIEVTRDSNIELFELTLGGHGLTGVILSAKLNLIEVPSNVLDLSNERFSTLFEAYQILKKYENDFDYFHGWCDLSNIQKGKETGFITFGKFSQTASIVKENTKVWSTKKQHNKILLSVFNTFLIKIVGKIYVFLNLYLDNKTKSFYDFTFPSSKKFYYWSFIGKKGVVEMQMIIPDESVKEYLKELNALLYPLGINYPLCHMKLFNGKRKYINFNGKGFCLAIHFPNNKKSQNAMHKVDALNTKYGCISSFVKDTRISNKVMQNQYGYELNNFKSKIKAYDPDLTFQNNQTKIIFE